MLWIGQLKRLKSAWLAAIKSSQTGYRHAADGWLYRCLIQQIIVIFSFFFLSCHWQIFTQICKYLWYACWSLYFSCCFLPAKIISKFIHPLILRSAACLLSEKCSYKAGGSGESEAEVGGREDCVAVSLWLSSDLKWWSDSFRLTH